MMNRVEVLVRRVITGVAIACACIALYFTGDVLLWSFDLNRYALWKSVASLCMWSLVSSALLRALKAKA
jgi:hypothetical protein